MFPTNDRTIEVRLQQRALQASPSGTSSVTRVAKLARLARLWKRTGLLEGCGVQNVQPHCDQIRQRLPCSWPINAGLCRRAWGNPHGAYTASSAERRKARYGSNQRLTNGDYVCLRKETPEPLPILLIGQGINVGSHRLIHIYSQGSAKPFGYARYVRQTQVIRLHHYGDNRYGHAQPYATLGLLMNEFPIAVSALCILFWLRRIVERKLNVVKGAHLLITKNGNAVAIRCDGQLYRLSAQVGQYVPEVWMHSVLASAEIHRADRKPFHNGLHLVQGETIGASRIAVAEGTGKITFVGKPEPERDTFIRRGARCDR